MGEIVINKKEEIDSCLEKLGHLFYKSDGSTFRKLPQWFETKEYGLEVVTSPAKLQMIRDYVGVTISQNNEEEFNYTVDYISDRNGIDFSEEQINAIRDIFNMYIKTLSGL